LVRPCPSALHLATVGLGVPLATLGDRVICDAGAQRAFLKEFGVQFTGIADRSFPSGNVSPGPVGAE
jgi:hypothetical protein